MLKQAAFFTVLCTGCLTPARETNLGETSVFQIEQLSMADPECVLDQSTLRPVGGGSLDVGTEPQYFLQLQVGSRTAEPLTEPFELRFLKLSYSLRVPGAAMAVALRTDEVRLATMIEPADPTLWFVTNIIGPKGAEDLLAKLAPSSDEPVPSSDVGALEVEIDIEVKGIRSGEVTRTGAAHFPIQVYRSNVCDGGFKLNAFTPCQYAGQDRRTRSIDPRVDCN
ncbi:MAG: hypothetical protein JNG84_01695 [Archangium sp.]|nr:hypothetical protein [Archangium sp.]